MEKEIEIEVSARHIHLSPADFEILFGANCEFREIKELSQSGEFATDKEVEIVGPKGTLQARFLSPFRDKTQVEISLTDCYSLGINAPYEIDVFDGAAEITINGSAGKISRKAVIVAKRHLHSSPNEAKDLGLTEGQQVSVKIETNRGKIVFENITVKIAENYHLRIHLDLDEGNAAGISGQCFGKLISGND